MNRSRFLLSSASTAALAACSSNSILEPASSGSSLSPASSGSQFTRLEIAEFSKNRELVAAFRTGIDTMRKITDPRNVGSYAYWHYSHWMPDSNPPPAMRTVWDQCKHQQSFFMSWHRGFLYYFEKVLREASGNPQFALPYWDYYKDPDLPKIFAEPTLPDGSPNPLYWANRVRSTVAGLNFKAFADSVTVFPWGPGETFEDLTERNPHGRVHSQIGGSMGRVPTAPADPIFWVHHSNIDRYWSAWIAAGGGRHMPPKDDVLFWKEQFVYNLDGSWNLSVREMDDSENLGYTYDNLSLPTPPPGASLPLRPPTVAIGSANAVAGISLGLRPVTVEIPLDEAIATAQSVEVVLEGVELTPLGIRGGYDYSVYANLLSTRTPIAQEGNFEIGEFGSFTLTMPGMTAMPMPSAAGRTLRFATLAPGRLLRLSFVAFGASSQSAQNAELVRISRIAVRRR